MSSTVKPDPVQTLKSAKKILLIDWPDQGVPRTLLNAGFAVFGYSPNGYSQAQLVAELAERVDEKNSFPPRGKDENGHLIFKKLYYSPNGIDIVNVYRPEAELPGIIVNRVLPSGTKVLWLHPPVTSGGAAEIAAENGLILIEGVNIAEIAAKL